MGISNIDVNKDAVRRAKWIGYAWLASFVCSIIINEFWIQEILTQTTWCKPLFYTFYGNFFTLIFVLKAYFGQQRSQEMQILDIGCDQPDVPVYDQVHGFWASFMMGFKTSPLNIADMFLDNVGLIYLTVPTEDLCHSFSIVVAFMLSVILKREKCTVRSIVPVFLMMACAAGLYFQKPINAVTGEDGDQLVGYMIGIASAFAMGTLSVVFNQLSDPFMIGANVVNEDALFAGQSVGGVVLSVPVLLISHLSRFETFELPEWSVFCQLTLLGMIVSPMCIYSFGKASMAISPIVVQMSTSICGPLTAIIDQLLGAHTYGFGYLLGMMGTVVFCIILSVVIERGRKIMIAENIAKIQAEEGVGMIHTPPHRTVTNAKFELHEHVELTETTARAKSLSFSKHTNPISNVSIEIGIE